MIYSAPSQGVVVPRGAAPMAAASVTPPGTLDALQFGFAKTVLGTKLEDKYLCSACKNVLRRPFQEQCGHRYCSFCLSSILRYWMVGGPGRRAAGPGRGHGAGAPLGAVLQASPRCWRACWQCLGEQAEALCRRVHAERSRVCGGDGCC